MDKRFWRAAALALAVIWVGIAWGAQGTRTIKAPESWEPTVLQTLGGTSFADAPTDGAGCLVVGYYILRNGTVAKARILQGAFSRGTPESVQKSFTEAALAAASGWKFQYVGRFPEPEPKFEWTVLGYGRSRPGALRKSLLGAEAQDERVRSACMLEHLADWGKKQALAIETVPDHKDRILIPHDEPASAFWVIDGDMLPPRYPGDLARRGIQGCVVVGATIDRYGKPTQFRVMASLTSRSDKQARKLFENASVQAVAQWRFAPGPDNPERMPAFLQFPIDFLIDSHSPMKACAPVDPRGGNRVEQGGT